MLAQHFPQPAFRVLYAVTVYRHSCATVKLLWAVSELHGVLGFCGMGAICLCAQKWNL